MLRAARYLDDKEEVEFGELHVFLGENFVITLRHSESPDLSVVRTRLESTPDLLGLGTEAVMYAILDAVVDGYAPVVAGLENDIDEIEGQVFDGDPSVSRRIYDLSREVIDFQLAVRPLSGILEVHHRRVRRRAREHGPSKVPARRRRSRGLGQRAGRRVPHHPPRHAHRQRDPRRPAAERRDAAGRRREHRQAEEARKISGWAAILFAPSLITGIYGMNFQFMPELNWAAGYPFALALMVGVSGTLYAIFHKRGWL